MLEDTVVAASHPPPDDQDDRDTRLRLVADLLQAEYRSGPWHSHGDPVSELVSTILSQNTSDINTARAFRSLRSELPTWTDVVNAATSVVADAIRSGGLANTKAPRIQAVLRTIRNEAGDFDLGWLDDLSVEEGRRALTQLPGVGPKTASIVLLFSLGKPAFPVDTHVHRVCVRLGVVDARSTPEQVQDAVEAEFGDDREALYALHRDMIEHGRLICVARRPRCDRCILAPWCDYARQRQGNGTHELDGDVPASDGAGG